MYAKSARVLQIPCKAQKDMERNKVVKRARDRIEKLLPEKLKVLRVSKKKSGIIIASFLLAWYSIKAKVPHVNTCLSFDTYFTYTSFSITKINTHDV